MVRKAVLRLLQKIRKKMMWVQAGRVGGIDGSERWVFTQLDDGVRLAQRWEARRSHM